MSLHTCSEFCRKCGKDIDAERVVYELRKRMNAVREFIESDHDLDTRSEVLTKILELMNGGVSDANTEVA